MDIRISMNSLRSKRTNLAVAKFRTKIGGKSDTEGGEADTIYLLARVTLRRMVESQSGMAEPHLRGKNAKLHRKYRPFAAIHAPRVQGERTLGPIWSVADFLV